MTPVGLPHSEIPGSMRACRSPRHIAACHVFLRLSVPRHPPSTLSNLTIKCLDLMRSAVSMSLLFERNIVVHLFYFFFTRIQLSKKLPVAKTNAERHGAHRSSARPDVRRPFRVLLAWVWWS